MKDIIEQYYKKYNFPSVDKLYQILKNDGHNINKKDIKEILDAKYENELTKVKTKRKKRMGHIIALDYGENAQMDIYDLSKYKKKNKNYRYILVLIDVFSRKAFARPLKSKDISDIIESAKSIFKEYIPQSITSDSDSAFMSHEFQKLLNKHEIFHDVIIASNDHQALGIIDRFALTIKTIFTKLFLINDNTNWISELDDVVYNYNHTPHKALEGITPTQAMTEEYHHLIASINHDKIKKFVKQNHKSEFEIGDKVRRRIKEQFRKGSEPKYSDKVYDVINVNGRRVTLSNDKTYVESDLVKAVNYVENNPITKAKKENKIDRLIKKAGVTESNIIEREKRVKKPNKKYID